MNKSIELYVKIRIPAEKVAELYPDAVTSYDGSPDTWEIAKRLRKDIVDGNSTVQDFWDMATAHNEAIKDVGWKDRPAKAEVKLATSASDTYLWEDIQRTIERQAPFLTSEATRSLTESVLECLGHSVHSDNMAPAENTPRGPDASLVRALKKLTSYAPEYGYTDEMAALIYAADEGSYDDLEDCQLFLNDYLVWDAKHSDKPYEEEYETSKGEKRMRRTVAEKKCPLITEAVLYPLVGKDDARTLLAYVHDMGRKLNIPRHEL